MRALDVLLVVLDEFLRGAEDRILVGRALVPVDLHHDGVGELAEGLAVGGELGPERLVEEWHVGAARRHLARDQERVLVVRRADEDVRRLRAHGGEHARNVGDLLGQLEAVQDLEPGAARPAF